MPKDICVEEAANFALLDKVIEYVKQKHEIKQDKWISGTEAMAMLSSKVNDKISFKLLFSYTIGKNTKKLEPSPSVLSKPI